MSFSRLKALHLAVLAWTPSDDRYLEKMVLKEQALVNRYAYTDPPFVWLARVLENGKTQYKPLTAEDFWSITATTRPDTPTAANQSIPAMYTLAGKAEIDPFSKCKAASIRDRYS